MNEMKQKQLANKKWDSKETKKKVEERGMK
jgi:hypothetical protein